MTIKSSSMFSTKRCCYHAFPRADCWQDHAAEEVWSSEAQTSADDIAQPEEGEVCRERHNEANIPRA